MLRKGKAGLVCRPKAGFLCKRGELEQLLEAAGAKERAYRELWPDARAVPRLRTGVPGGGLLGFGDTCPDCRGDCADQAGVGAAPTPARRRLVVRRRYPSGVRRKAGNLAIPEGDGPVTGACLRGLLKDQMSLPVAKLLVVRGGDADGAEVELQDSEVLAEGVDHIVVEKDEGVQPAVEAAAFQGSVFRGPAARGAAA
ncbi:unnamed protein product [Prorocentrum cordatum]|uniref:Uncharacterized protein n=1 Tax=Prorocentrum cordatum TaxID=2364126 RepID=A0ABN9V7S3_9DINO|nr:unnamed protein product [Polarella glacialis]